MPPLFFIQDLLRFGPLPEKRGCFICAKCGGYATGKTGARICTMHPFVDSHSEYNIIVCSGECEMKMYNRDVRGEINRQFAAGIKESSRMGQGDLNKEYVEWLQSLK